MTTEDIIGLGSIIVAVVLAFIGYLITYLNNLRLTRRSERLQLIDKKIGDFYGPLYVATQRGSRAYKALKRKVGPRGVFDGDFDSDTKPLTEAEIKEWCLWWENVFMPNNLFVEQLITENAYLIEEEEMPECLLDFVTHVSGYKVVLAKWQEGDLSEMLSIVDYPSELTTYASRTYRALKAKQLALIGKTDRRS